MARIQIDPDQIQDFARQIAQAGREMADVRSRLAQTWTHLHTVGWEGGHRARADGLWHKAQNQAGMLSEQAAALSRFLHERAIAFQEADRVGVATLSQVVAEALSLSAATRNWMAGLLQRFASFPREAIARMLQLAEIFEARVNWSALVGGLGLLSILRGLGIENIPSPATTPTPTPSSGQLLQEKERKPSAEPYSRFGELLREWEEEKAKAPPHPPPPSTMPPVYKVPVFKQRGRSYECGPTSVSMILHYYGKEGAVLTRDQIIKRLGWRFNPSKGIAADKLVDGLREMDLGYRTIEWAAGLTKEDLLSELRQGPVIAQVHLGLGSFGNAHMVVVTGASEGGKFIHINDPWTGKARRLTWESFEKAWTFPHYSHLIVRIRP